MPRTTYGTHLESAMAIASVRPGTAARNRSTDSAPQRRGKVVARGGAPATEAAVPVLRRFALDAVRRWEVPGEITDRLPLVVTDLVTAAVRHSRGADVVVAVEFDGETLAVEVRDSGTWCGRWTARRIAEDATGGRGPRIVRCCATWWRALTS
ncbi:ATP-binding protein [Kitasatospora sp. NPDC058965]|uniref:ATP-binding protein n=1 Tax=Kitasatospora sp. NPDC058965 TaxID=3346682 RepID=UPI00367FA5AE